MGLVNGHGARDERRRRLQRRAACGLLTAALLAPIPALAQSNTSTAPTQAAILESGSIVAIADMDFGRIVTPLAAGTVVLSASSSPTCTVTGGLVRSGLCRAAQFSLLATKQSRARLNHPGNGTITLTGPGGATMQVTDLTLGLSGLTPTTGGGNANLGRYDITAANGIANFWVGGTLHVNAAQAPGVYNGQLVIQVQFN